MPNPGTTQYHTKYLAHMLTARAASDDPGKLSASVFNATVDLNPHQLDAALFAFRSPLSRGAILADEVGLGKTIEAGLIISQLWAEHRRRILVIAPMILRKQWAQELSDKFFLSSRVLDTRDYNLAIRQGRDPLSSADEVFICSYHFAAARPAVFGAVPWDLIVIDEAHRLRNVWKPTNKIANALHSAVASKPLVLLTATPLQNSLLELYGLVSFIDEHMFGSIDAFKTRYMRGPLEERQLGELRQRLKPICQRTLRRQVQEYVRFTNRIPIIQDFTPTPEEQKLYDEVSEYLRRPKLHALPSSQRQLMTLVARKLLASSSFAISKTLNKLASRLNNGHAVTVTDVAEDHDTAEERPPDEWPTEVSGASSDSVDQRLEKEILAELGDLRQYGALADSILINAKGTALLDALETGFSRMAALGAPRKSVIFTESRRTQEYLLDLLNASGFSGRAMSINGTNTDDRSGEIYKEWTVRHKGSETVTGNKQVDLRAALVEHFRDHADILIATEAASEGVNLQFCSLVINYDLPWNPQRIEQRIGRCHRYGQAFDVVVVNFINRSNAADQRVFELLDEKFKLFDGLFGSSDEVLGALESGVDFERRIGEIYQTCRTREEIDAAFDQLRADLDEEINVRMTDTRARLLENFDEDVHTKLRLSRDQSTQQLDKLERALWTITRFELEGHADFDDASYEFYLRSQPPSAPDAALGSYRFVRHSSGSDLSHPYRLGHGLAQSLLETAQQRSLPMVELRFQYTGCGRKIGLLDPLVGKSGALSLHKLTLTSFESEDKVLAAIINDEGEPLLPEIGAALFELHAEPLACSPFSIEHSRKLEQHAEHLKNRSLNENQERNRKYFDEEIDKLDRWSDDLKTGLEAELKDVDQQIRQAAKDSKLAPTLDAKLSFARQQKDLESVRSKKRRELFEEQDRIDLQKGELIQQVEAKMKLSSTFEHLFTIQFSVI